MTVSAQTSFIAHAGAGTTGPFAVPFRFLQPGDLVLEKEGADGLRARLTPVAVTGAGEDAGGAVQTAEPVAAGETLRIWRETPRVQPVDYIAADAFPAETHEGALDRLTLIAQDQARDLGRTLKVSPGDQAPADVSYAQIITDVAAQVGDNALAQIAAAGAEEVGMIVLQGALAVEGVEQAVSDGVEVLRDTASTIPTSISVTNVPIFENIQSGLSEVSDGQKFAVSQSFGSGAYFYTRSGGAAVFQGCGLYGPRGQTIAVTRQVRKSPVLVPPMPTGFTVNIWGLNAQEYDGRVLVNERSFAAPTLNLLPDPFTLLKENGSSSPATIENDPNLIDPAGGSNAIRATFNAAFQQYIWFNATEGDLPSGDYRVGATFKSVSGAVPLYRVGATSNVVGEYNQFAADGSWSRQVNTTSGYDNVSKGFSLGIATGSGNVDGVVAVYGGFIFDTHAGSVLPSDGALLSEANDGHARRAMAFPGSIIFNSRFSIDNRSALDNILINIYASATTNVEMTLGLWLDAATLPSGTYGNALAVDYHDANNNSSKGLIGIYGAASQEPGRPYCIPTLNAISGRTSMRLIGAGMTSFFISIKAGEVTPYINGVPIYSITNDNWQPATIKRLVSGAYNGTIRRRKFSNILPAVFDGYAFAPRAMSQAEITLADAHGRGTLRQCGGRAGLRKACVIGICDSMTAFGESYFNQLGRDLDFSPPLHAHIEAVGGTNLADWVSREAFLKRQISAAKDADYNEIWIFALAGANEFSFWQNGVGINGGSGITWDYSPWRNDFISYLQRLKAVAPDKVKLVVLTMMPRAGVPGLPYSTGSLANEDARQRWNADVKANFSSYGLTDVIDTGSDIVLGSYSASASAVPSSGSWTNLNFDTSQYQSGGTHVTTAGGVGLKDRVVKPWVVARLKSLNGEV